jgi:hypothetical protein
MPYQYMPALSIKRGHKTNDSRKQNTIQNGNFNEGKKDDFAEFRMEVEACFAFW